MWIRLALPGHHYFCPLLTHPAQAPVEPYDGAPALPCIVVPMNKFVGSLSRTESTRVFHPDHDKPLAPTREIIIL